MTRLTAGILCSFLTVVCHARIITVDDDGTADFDNIQAAIDDANNGDTVIVADGTYTGTGNYNLDFGGRRITVCSQTGPGSCIIDCQNSGRGFYFHSGENANSVVEGFTIKNGRQWQGGAIRCISSSPTISNCTIRDNEAVTVDTWLGVGGAIQCEESMMILSNCRLIDNTSSGDGGALCSYSYSGTGNISIVDCTFVGNSAAAKGGAVYCYKDNLTLRNCVITDNIAGKFGGAVHCRRTNPEISKCTITGNSAGERGGGLYCWAGSTTLLNSILWQNAAPVGHEIKLNSSPFGTTSLMISYNDIEAGTGSISVDGGCVLNWGSGNIHADPCFTDSGNGDYHLRSQVGRWDPNTKTWVTDANTSPCIDAGNPGCLPGEEPDPNGNRINMGAYGGTAQASKSPQNWAMLPDVTNDHKVDSNDLKILAYYWLESGPCLPSDFSRDQLVNATDFAILALEWSGQIQTAPGIDYEIGDCDMIPQDASSDEPNFSVWVEGRYIHFEDMIYANCCPDELGLERQINGNQITLYEIGYGGMCDCDCNFPVTATLGPFDDGTYTVEVIDNYGQSLGAVVVVIGGPDEPGMAYHIAYCDPQAPTSLVATQPENTRFTLTVEGQYLHFQDMILANCCPDKLELEMTVDENLITIREIETTTSPCRCTCEYPVTAILGPFQEGTYNVEVFDNYGQSLGAVEVVIGGSDGPSIAYTIADCDPAAPGSFAAVQSQQTRFAVTVEGQYIHFEDMMVANCCPEELGLEMTVEPNIITILETEYTPGGCWCICDYPVTATLGPFEPGIYTLEVYEDYGGFIGSAIVVIGSP